MTHSCYCQSARGGYLSLLFSLSSQYYCHHECRNCDCRKGCCGNQASAQTCSSLGLFLGPPLLLFSQRVRLFQSTLPLRLLLAYFFGLGGSRSHRLASAGRYSAARR